MTIDNTWWKDSTIYQIWPASYKDSNGDGVGDIPGIISTLDYLKDLGVDIIWLSPMYDSPQDDMGYDISDYQNIYPKYGTLEDMQNLIDGCHERDMKIICDLVINHTSSQHAWFKESRSSKTNAKRDWYIWKKPRYDESGNRLPPNNWMSHFSGSAWEFDELTQEYYLKLFAISQPDLNWENKEVRDAIYDTALKFWFDRGVDGFRIDTAGMYSKDQAFPDAPIVFPDQYYQPSGLYTNNGPRIHEFHKEMYKKVTSKYDVMTVGEVGHCSREQALKYVSASEKEMNMMFLFDVVEVGCSTGDRFRYKGWELKDFKKAVENQCQFIEGTDAWSTVFIENHDQARSVSRFGNPQYREKSAKLLSLLQASLTGTLFIYQGQEIGMTNLPASWSIDEYKDINTINYYKQFVEKYGKDADFDIKEKKLMNIISQVARDHARSPVQWDSTAYGGFSTGKPWTRVNDNFKEINVKSQLNDSNSVLNFWRESLKVRKEYKDLFIHGEFKILDFDNTKSFTFIKESHKDSQKAYVVLNFSTDSVEFSKLIDGSYKLVHSNVEDVKEDVLSPYEGRIYIVD
ncbi:alpha-glucosidase maltase [Spathaspora passalidarum NRRL Y-27907]|uniref:Alpha-glucosidase n=1 Tax=Spathaspora passalidarum (strain NRRL Y-27907 / 11-Y1) TaxID=619300 RepID=G3AE04_SPAPN|nr:alpha-glucosidase maltase [Spathaspora passalidarum NRRL Y-27907]EGW34728.1 alpha-glucosidase maltase [Spathaspora passalidarum NRRL Y-27907]